jgi:MFS family permease
MSSQFSLLNRRRFGPFFATQFLGAFNDNLFKNALIVLLTFQTAQWTTLPPELLANLAAGIFILPFFLFSATAGQLADKYDKAVLARWVKLLEISIMLVAGIGFWWHSLNLLMSCLFLLGLHSTLFGPVKYAILPQHLHEDELVGGNALIEAGTFVAILVGTLCGGLLTGLGDGTFWITLACLATAVAGYLSSRRIPDAPAPEPALRINPNPITETWRNIGFARENRTVFLSILGISWFWLFGALMLAQFPAYAKNVLGGTETSVTLLLGVFTLGIGFGSLLCERLSAKQLEIGLVPFGSIGLWPRSGLCLASVCTTPAVVDIAAVGTAIDGACADRSLRHRPVRRFFHCSALCADPVAFQCEPPGPDHRGQQHHQCVVHGGRGRGGGRDVVERTIDTGALWRGRALQCRGGDLYLSPGS